MDPIKVSNPSETRELRANVEGQWYCIEPGGSMTTDDPRVASGLAQYGGVVDRDSLLKATDAMAAENRAENAKHASAPASETPTRGGRGKQTTTDPSGTGRGSKDAGSTPPAYDGSTPPGDAEEAAVLAYLAGASEEDRARVIAAEQARGKDARAAIAGYTAAS